MSNTDYDSKAQFLEAVRDGGAEIDGVEYFTEGEGSATTYKARSDDSEKEVTKSEVEDAWDEHQDNETEATDDPEEVPLGTFYYSQSNWEDQHRKTLEKLLSEEGWYIDSEVDSGGYRIKTKI
jgi:hypothetical protein